MYLISSALAGRAQAIPVFANGQRVSCQTCHTTIPGMTRYGMSVMMTNFQILNEHLQNQALPLSVRIYISSYLANREAAASTTVDDLSLLSGGFLGPNMTWYGEQHIIDGGQIGQTEQLWISWNRLLGGTNSLQVGKFHTPFPFMPAHAWTLSPYLLATQTSGQNDFAPADSRWGVAFSGMSNEFMYNLSWLTGTGPTGDALDFNSKTHPRALDMNLSYGGMLTPWTIGAVAMRGTAPLTDPDSGVFLQTELFSREGVYLAYQDNRWHFQTMVFHGVDAQPDVAAAAAPLNGFFVEAERDIGWRNHLLLRYDVAFSDTLERQYVFDAAHDLLPNLALVGEIAASPGRRSQIGLRIAYAGPYLSRKSPAQTISAAVPPPAGNANAGAALVQANGCEGCHGTALRGGRVGPALYGIEHRLSSDQIADFIQHPRAPMPNFGLNDAQIGDIVEYLSDLDGGLSNAAPIVTFEPAVPIDAATLVVRFPGTPPQRVSAIPVMHMGTGTHHTALVQLQQSSSDPHTFTGRVEFTMGGPWVVQIQYDDHELDIPLNVGS